MLGLGLGLGGAARQGANAFDPASIFGASDDGAVYIAAPSSTFQVSNGTTAVSENDPVGYLTDLSGKGNHAIQTTPGARPTMRLSGGRYYLEGDGVDDFLVCLGPELSGTHSAVVAVRASDNIASPYGIHGGFWGAVRLNASTGRWQRQIQTSAVADTTTIDVSGVLHVLSVVHPTNSETTSWVNGANSAGAVDPRNDALTGQGIAILTNQTGAFSGGAVDFYCGVFIDRAITNEERALCEAWAASVAGV